MKVYLDNAATTPIDPEVFEAMTPFLTDYFGNPSSTHSHGRIVRAAIEKARKLVADLLNCTPGEIFFTSGGTEADNTILRSTIKTHGLKHAITSSIEHHAVLHTLQKIANNGKIELSLVNLDSQGHVDLDHLQELLAKEPKSMVSLMHGNNEIGNLNPIEEIGSVCADHGAYFHSDTVQTMGHFEHDLSALKLHGLAAGAHKLHGPKGAGFMYINKASKIHPFIIGGSQERSMRGGTENVSGIIGTATALEVAYRDMEDHHNHIQGIKDRMISKLTETIVGVEFNGDSAIAENSLYTVLNVSLPESPDNDMLLFNLDLAGISASGGSACSSGASIGSHVLSALNSDPLRGAVRFSFSKFTTEEEVDYAVEQLAKHYHPVKA